MNGKIGKKHRDARRSTERLASCSLTWAGPNYARIAPGSYQAVCVGVQGPEYVWAYQRHALRLEFALLDGETLVSMFLNMGKGERPPGRRSRFFKVWAMANGGPPLKGQQMTVATFTEAGLLYTLRIDDCDRDADDPSKVKPDALIYSRVSDVLSVVRAQMR